MICFTADEINKIDQKRETCTVMMARVGVKYEGKKRMLEIQYRMADGLYYILLDDQPVSGQYAAQFVHGFSSINFCCAQVNGCFAPIS